LLPVLVVGPARVFVMHRRGQIGATAPLLEY
jgi:hypothetical protein